MAKKLLDLEEAAKMVGVTPDTLNEMRERREVFGLRDGGNWKFKQEDLEKLVAARAEAEEEGEFAELDEDPDSILLSEVELGQSGEGTSSTIIGGKSDRKRPADSDIQLAPTKDEDELTLAVDKHDSDLDLDAALTDDRESGSDVLTGGGGVSPMFDDLDTLDLEMPSAADSGISSNVVAGVSPAPGGSSGLSLSDDAGTIKLDGGSKLSMGDEVLALGEESGIQLEDSKAGGSAIDLTEDLDDDLVLGGSSHGDVSRTGDSGISLLDPADSGLSLESAPLELGGSAVESLELGEDEIGIEEPPAKKGVAARQQSDDDFLLTPLDEGSAEESDSGSQVIALEADVEFEEASGVAIEESGAMGGLLEDDLGEGLGAAAALGATALAPATATMTAAGPAVTVAAPEASFTGWNVASLVLCAVFLLMTGMFMYDLVRNMWSWNQPYAVNSALMNVFVSWFGK